MYDTILTLLHPTSTVELQVPVQISMSLAVCLPAYGLQGSWHSRRPVHGTLHLTSETLTFSIQHVAKKAMPRRRKPGKRKKPMLR